MILFTASIPASGLVSMPWSVITFRDSLDGRGGVSRLGSTQASRSSRSLSEAEAEAKTSTPQQLISTSRLRQRRSTATANLGSKPRAATSWRMSEPAHSDVLWRLSEAVSENHSSMSERGQSPTSSAPRADVREGSRTGHLIRAAWMSPKCHKRPFSNQYSPELTGCLPAKIRSTGITCRFGRRAKCRYNSPVRN